MPIKVHSAIFVELTNHSSFPESSHSTFFLTSFNDDCKAQLSRGGPRDSFAPLVEWVLVSNNSPFTIGPAKDRLTSPTPDSEPSLPSPRWAEQESEPTTADEPYGATVLRIALKLEPNISDQVQEPATVLATGENTMDRGEHYGQRECGGKLCPMSKGESSTLDYFVDLYADMPPLLPPFSELSACPELSASPETTMEVVPLSLALSMLELALWCACVWAARLRLGPSTQQLHHGS